MSFPPKINGFERTCLFVAAGGLGDKIISGASLAGVAVWAIALVGGIVVAAVSFYIRGGYKQ